MPVTSAIVTSEDANAFMRKYLSQPTDVTARLVFADWLEETAVSHNLAWAYYIRLKAEADRYGVNSRRRRELDRQAEEYVPKIRANLTIPATLFVGYPKSLLQLLPAPNLSVMLANFEVQLPVLELMPESVARDSLVLPLDMQGRTLLVAAAAARDRDLIQRLGDDSPLSCEAWSEIALLKDAQGDWNGAIEAIARCKRVQKAHEEPYWTASQGLHDRVRELITAVTRALNGCP